MLGFWSLLFIVVLAAFGPLIIGVTINVLDAILFPNRKKEDTDGKES